MKKSLIPSMLMLLVLIFGSMYSYSEELPKPTYDNSLIFSWTLSFLYEDASEINSIINQYGNGIYAPLCFSSFVGVNMDWNTNPQDSGSGIQTFKNKLDNMMSFARQYNVGIHLTINYGISRNVNYYNSAKEEDIRNCQWYNDNNISSQAQMSSASVSVVNEGQGAGEENQIPGFDHVNEENFLQDRPMADSSVVNKYVFTSMSRYARKLRAHLEAKVGETLDYLAQQQDANPGVIIVISAPGESELSYYRLNDNQAMQEYFCDYSPFAVLEFRDWVKHEGLYADGEKYAGQGYANGGGRYQGGSGLANFNADFGTSFTTWDLKYFNWGLSDPVDTDYTDGANPDPNVIPVAQYTYNGMMPASGANYTAGGFDAPRVMQEPGANAYYDLWHTFRENMVNHFVKDMANIARDSGFPKKQYYTHQIPGDYLFGTRPNDSFFPSLNPRYYASASPMWTADAYPDIGLGVTLYDINFGTWFARTTRYGIGAADAMSDNWAALEYNPEVIPVGIAAVLSSVQTLYNEMVRLYNGSPHVISFFVWKGNSGVYDFKGNNLGTAAKQFFDAIKDNARQAIGTVFTPKNVENFTGSYSTVTALVNLSWSSKIWTDLNHSWADWGDFKEFVIYRGYTEDFTANSGSVIARVTAYSYIDSGFTYGSTVYYKIAALNSSGVAGPTRTVSVVTPQGVPTPILSVSRKRLNFGYVMGGSASPSQVYYVSNAGTGALNWTASADAGWLVFTPSSGIIGAPVTVSTDPSGLSAGVHSAVITVSAPQAVGSPQTIAVYLTVKNAHQDQPPFGSFETPVDGAVVNSSIAVTGWVLDDVGVESVKIYRDPEPGEGSASIYIGDAVLVDGARADIETSYPDYPCNYKAGWGYMMLTNFMPNKGNGTFRLLAKAVDCSGHEVTLGTKTITCDNANAFKPFGAIDTPAQGGTVSGSGFVNWGWVLTPQPNSIPTNGSTVNVYVDGIYIGHPTYNSYRSDIASLFPSYANSSGAGGYFTLDTTQYADGVHSIFWTARDSAGNSDGIGSRYFTIRNTGGNAQSRARGAGRRDTPGYLELLPDIPIDNTGTIGVKKNNHRDKTTREVSPDKKGIITIEIKELARIELHLNETGNTNVPIAYQVVGKQRRALPTGSTFDPKKGVFYWQTGPGFVGDYILDFVVTGSGHKQLKMKKKRVKIRILPGTGEK